MKLGNGVIPCSRENALIRMAHLAQLKDTEYQLGTGDFNKNGVFRKQYDCAGAAISEAYMLTRHREGFASGTVPVLYKDQSDVDDDINTNSVIEDALTKQEVFEIVNEGEVLPGDLVMYATLRINWEGEVKLFIGHVAMFYKIPPGWTRSQGFHLCRMLQCCGPNGRSPAVIETDGSAFDKHDRDWPKEQHRCQIIRVKQVVG